MPNTRYRRGKVYAADMAVYTRQMAADNSQEVSRLKRNLIRALKEEGLIKTEERKPSYVTYCRPQCTPDTYLVQSVLKGRTSILQVYRTMELLLPAIYTFSLEVCSSDMQKLCFAQLYKDSRKDLRTRWKSASLSL